MFGRVQRGDLHDEGHGDVQRDEVHDELEGVVEQVSPHRGVVQFVCPELPRRGFEKSVSGDVFSVTTHCRVAGIDGERAGRGAATELKRSPRPIRPRKSWEQNSHAGPCVADVSARAA